MGVFIVIKIIEGNLLESDCTIIGHQTNCIKQMKSGIAKQIKERYPLAEKMDNEYELQNMERLGTCSYAFIENEERLICNLYGQYKNERRPEGDTDKEALIKAISSMVQYVKTNPYSQKKIKIGLPFKIGCGLGGGNWDEIYEEIRTISENEHIDIYLYKLE